MPAGLSPFTGNRSLRERLWQRVQERACVAPKAKTRPATQWVKPGLFGV